MNILLVEDNESIIKGLEYTLTKEGYKVTVKMNVEDSIDYITIDSNIDLVILDITLPDGNGLDLYKDYIKEKNISTIILTAIDTEDYIVNGLNMGAEDYITKPFSTKELLARINRILLRNKKMSIIKIKDISYDMDKLILYKNDKEVELSALELKIVNLLFNNLNKTVNRNILLDKILDWTGNYVDDHTITVYLKRIKDKVGTDIIKTVKGMGYRIDEE